MFAPSAFRIDNTSACLEHLARIGFGTLIVSASSGPVVAHAPVVVETRNEAQFLQFHLARPNPAVSGLAETSRATFVGVGPDHYISPDWYQSPDLVPTWNYIAVHASGPVRPLDEAGLRAVVDALAARYESDLAPKPPWTSAKMSPRKLTTMLRGIVGYELTIEHLEGTAKMSQNKSAQDVDGAVRGLTELDTDSACKIAGMMQKVRPAT